MYAAAIAWPDQWSYRWSCWLWQLRPWYHRDLQHWTMSRLLTPSPYIGSIFCSTSSLTVVWFSACPLMVTNEHNYPAERLPAHLTATLRVSRCVQASVKSWRSLAQRCWCYPRWCWATAQLPLSVNAARALQVCAAAHLDPTTRTLMPAYCVCTWV